MTAPTAPRFPAPAAGEFIPAWFCPNIAYLLKWEPYILAWSLTLHDEQVATLNGYPIGRPGVTEQEATEWADHVIGTPQDWTPRPRNSGVRHTHNDPSDTCPPPRRYGRTPAGSITSLAGVVKSTDRRTSPQGSAWARVTLITGGGTWPVDVLPASFREFEHLLTAGRSIEVEARLNDRPGWAPFLALDIRQGRTTGERP